VRRALIAPLPDVQIIEKLERLLAGHLLAG
jgi:hypothetical protein